MSGAVKERLRRYAPAVLAAWCAAAPTRALAADDTMATADSAGFAPPMGADAVEASLPCLSVTVTDEDDPARLLDLALACYESEEYAASLTLLERLRAIDPNPVVLFNLGAVHAALGHCPEAREHYQLYLDQTQSEAGKADARQQLERLGECAEAAPSEQPAPKESTTTPTPSPAQELSGSARPAMVLRTAQPVTEGVPYGALGTVEPEPPSRLASWILLGGGAALAVASAGFAYASEREESAERNAGSSGEAVAGAQEDGRRYNTLAWACAGGALALATSGLLLIAFEPSADITGATAKPLQGAWSLRINHQF